mmetsp:Transcript_11951/g.10326  ORF Transcript_11951/g.10326 Transcript_11951/m.10326 type:complete len:82 (-) Transcript_11951:107-352(-)
MSLKEAADQVKTPKKSLDDYLRIFKQAKKGGFDFEKHKDSKIGMVRSFVRDLQKQGTLDCKIHDDITEKFFTYQSDKFFGN